MQCEIENSGSLVFNFEEVDGGSGKGGVFATHLPIRIQAPFEGVRNGRQNGQWRSKGVKM